MAIVNTTSGSRLKEKFKNCALDLYLISQFNKGYLDVQGVVGKELSTHMKSRFLRSYRYMERGFIPVHGCMDTLGKITIATTFESLNLFMSDKDLERYEDVVCHITLKKISEMEKLIINNKIHTPIILSKYGHIYEFSSFITFLDNMDVCIKVICPVTRQLL